MPSPFAKHWGLDPEVTFLNHGSFGACPTRVLEVQRRLRGEMESEPVAFMVEKLEPLLDASRRGLAWFIGAKESDVVFVPNATAGVNAVVRSLELSPGDELLTLSHAYNACVNVLRFVGERTGAKVVVAELPRFPRGPEEVVEALLKHASERTRLVMVCHVTSPTALVLPVKRVIEEFARRWPRADVLVDGAHAPGMLDVHVDDLGAAYYTANCHKWMCAPKGAAFLHVREDRQKVVRPHVISHGANSTRTDRSRFQVEFDWTGTDDPTAALCVGTAIEAMAEIWGEREVESWHGLASSTNRVELTGDGKGTRLVSEAKPWHGDGGTASMDRGAVLRAWSEIRARNRALCLEGRKIVARAVGADEGAMPPGEMIGSIAAIPLPEGTGEMPKVPPGTYPDPLQRWLVAQRRIQVPVSWFPKWPSRSVRISAQLFNDSGDYEQLAGALAECGEGK